VASDVRCACAATWRISRSTADKARGEFRVAGKLTEGKLNYEPGTTSDGKELGKDGKPLPLWPQAEHIKGSFVFERARMEIRGDTATTGGVALSNVKAVIPDLAIHDSMLEIDGNAAGPMQEFLKYVANSPVLEWISHFTDETQASGNAKLALSLRIRWRTRSTPRSRHAAIAEQRHHPDERHAGGAVVAGQD
jgi:uncharacterized protein YhdP